MSTRDRNLIIPPKTNSDYLYTIKYQHPRVAKKQNMRSPAGDIENVGRTTQTKKANQLVRRMRAPDIRLLKQERYFCIMPCLLTLSCRHSWTHDGDVQPGSHKIQTRYTAHSSEGAPLCVSTPKPPSQEPEKKAIEQVYTPSS